MPAYDIPSSSRFTVKRLEADAPDSVYYFTKPKTDNYPIAILCGGSTTKDSIIHFHRFVTTLTANYSDITMATINWSGAGLVVE